MVLLRERHGPLGIGLAEETRGADYPLAFDSGVTKKVISLV
jgi:hypothetical protein